MEPTILRTVKDQQRSARQLELGTARVEAFSDGFMAVIITIMALELRAPRGATLDAVREQLPGLRGCPAHRGTSAAVNA